MDTAWINKLVNNKIEKNSVTGKTFLENGILNTEYFKCFCSECPYDSSKGVATHVYYTARYEEAKEFMKNKQGYIIEVQDFHKLIGPTFFLKNRYSTLTEVNFCNDFKPCNEEKAFIDKEIKYYQPE